MNKILLSIFLGGLSYGAFADVDVIDDSQRYAYNDVSSKSTVDSIHEKKSASFVVSDNDEFSDPQREESSKLQLLFSKIETLQQELAELRGRVEVQDYQLEQAGIAIKKRQKGHKALASESKAPKTEVSLPNSDLTRKKTNKVISQHRSEPNLKQQSLEVADITKRAVSSDPMDEQLNYVAAYEHIKHKRFQEAIPAMQKFITSYPDGPYVANAHYWLGELYGVKGDFDKALAEFKIVINEFSDSTKLSAAQYKLGVTYEKIGERELAQSEFIKVTEAFPGTAVARLAKAKLK